MKPCGIGTLNNYHLADQVGEGTYGYVYKAVDRRTGEAVALKRYYYRVIVILSFGRLLMLVVDAG